MTRSLMQGVCVSAASAALFAGSADAGAQPIDVRVARWSQQRALQKSTALDVTARTVEWLAVPGGSTLPVATYVAGRAGGHDRLSESSIRIEGSVLAASLATQLLKRTIGRARPYAVGDSLPFDVSFFRRFGAGQDYRSFPSGHASAAFAAATSVAIEASRWAPRQRGWIGPTAYSLAALTGFARVYHDKHWASDVVAGAVIGALSAHVIEHQPVRRR